MLDAQGKVLESEQAKLKRTVMWRPFIVDLWDTRLPRSETRRYSIDVPANRTLSAGVEAQVHYHLLNEARRKRIGYDNTTAIHYPDFQKQLPITLLTRSQR